MKMRARTPRKEKKDRVERKDTKNIKMSEKERSEYRVKKNTIS